MNVAIIHHHLNRGGVTQVIANHLLALEREGTSRRVVILYGGRKEGWPTELVDSLSAVQVQLQPVAGLDYDGGIDHEAEGAQPSTLAGKIEAALSASGFEPNNSVLHVHNHSLGKNASLPGAIDCLAQRGYRQLLQIHDFAEDFRPDNYRHLATSLGARRPEELSALLYPQRNNLHYAVLNGRDHRVLTQFGIPPKRLHLLPNPVPSIAQLPDRNRARRKWSELFRIAPNQDLMLYPVRGIRRKNLGETLIWSVLAEGRSHVAVSLAPLNPVELPIYRHWVRLASSKGLPMSFDVGTKESLTFLENLSAADAILTTSVAEGFGMVYLEAWLAGRPLIGRDLPEITADFRDHEVSLDYLRPTLQIPVRWIGKTDWQASVQQCFQSMLNQYGLPEADEKQLDQQISSLLEDELVDFARLNYRQQSRVIEQLCGCSEDRDRLRTLNGWIAGALHWRGDLASDTIDQNRKSIESHYGLKVSGRRLSQRYDDVANSSGDSLMSDLPQRTVLESFLDVTRLAPLRLDR